MHRLLSFFALAVLLSSATDASEPVRRSTNDRASLEQELFRQLDRYISYPLLGAADMDGHVLVALAVDADGRVVPLEVYATSPELKAYVLRQLGRVDVGDDPTGAWKVTHVRFVFHQEV